MAEKGPSKKRKIEADVVDSSSESSRFWFEDGNIIITAQGTSFKVHRGVLSRHSEVFRDMFLIPQPESTETAPAYPVVDLSDTKEEVEYMLSALYDGLRCFGAQVKVTFAAVRALLVLGMKYHIQQLQDEAIRRLEICFPTQDPHFREAMNCFGTDYFSNTSFLMRLDDSITLFNLARKYDLKGILIRALTVFCRLELPKLLQGVVDSCGVHQSLSQDDLLRVLEGRDVLRRGCIDEDAMFDDTYHFECICEEGESNRFCEMGRCRMIEIFEEDYILGYEDFFEFIYNLEGIGKLLMCAGCYVEQVKTRNRIYNQVLDRVRKFLETPAQTVRLAS